METQTPLRKKKCETLCGKDWYTIVDKNGVGYVTGPIFADKADFIVQACNAYESDQKKIKALLGACEALAFDLNSTKLSGPVCWCDPNNSSNLCTTNCRNMQAAIALEGGERLNTMKRELVMNLADINTAVIKGKSLICPKSQIFITHFPAEVIMDMTGNRIMGLIRLGLYIYEPSNKD